MAPQCTQPAMVMGVAERSPEKLASESGYFDIDSQVSQWGHAPMSASG